MRIGFIGCVQSSKVALNTLLKMKDPVEIVGVITKRESNFNSDHVDLTPICTQRNIPVFNHTSKDDTQAIKFMKGCKPNIIYCFGWSYLLSASFLELAERGVIGFHPAKLPQNRGRHPIIWALALGLNETASTFFQMDNKADNGAILNQVDIKIDSTDNAASLYEKILKTTERQIPKFTKEIIKGNEVFTAQAHSLSTTWRKRSRVDGIIDWRMQATDIHNLIRALDKPYPGAEFLYKKNSVNVWKSLICKDKYPINIEHGKIIALESNNILVKCAGESAIWLLNIKLNEIQIGEYI